ncbi:MAG: aminopeptidase, partial [Oscillospiraceae bacterium]
MSEKKTMADNLKTMLFYEPKNACDVIDVCEIEVADEFCDGYKAFLDKAKTEREAVNVVEAKAIEKGFVKFEKNKEYKAGSKIYFNNRGKSIILAVIGKKSLEKGARLSAAHIDSPRLDLKPNPLYEDSEAAFFKTHYYGGIKKYQWTAIPLSLHGVIVKREGTKVIVNIGEDDNDPKFVVTDLLPHLGAEQMKRTLGEGIKGEELNVLIGSRPFSNDEMSERVKLNIINLLHEKYDIDESDFLSAELEIVPAFKACDIGFDRSLIGAYGHDDRVCAYPAAEAI